MMQVYNIMDALLFLVSVELITIQHKIFSDKYCQIGKKMD